MTFSLNLAMIVGWHNQFTFCICREFSFADIVSVFYADEFFTEKEILRSSSGCDSVASAIVFSLKGQFISSNFATKIFMLLNIP